MPIKGKGRKKFQDGIYQNTTRFARPTFWNLEDLNRHKKELLWLPIKVRHVNVAPWGYAFIEGSNILEPVDEKYENNHIEAFVKAVQYITHNDATYKSVAEWLTNFTGSSISDAGLHRLVSKRPILTQVYDDKKKEFYPREEREVWINYLDD